MIRLAIVEDHPAIADGLIALLSSEPDVTVVGSASDAASADRLIAAEELLLERQLLRGGLEHEGDALHRRRDLLMRGNAAEQGGVAAEQRAGAHQPLA